MTDFDNNVSDSRIEHTALKIQTADDAQHFRLPSLETTDFRRPTNERILHPEEEQVRIVAVFQFEVRQLFCDSRISLRSVSPPYFSTRDCQATWPLPVYCSWVQIWRFLRQLLVWSSRSTVDQTAPAGMLPIVNCAYSDVCYDCLYRCGGSFKGRSNRINSTGSRRGRSTAS